MGIDGQIFCAKKGKGVGFMRTGEPIEDQVKCELDGSVFYIPRKLFSIMVLRCQYPEKKFVRYKDGAVLYGMSEREFNKLAHNAGAVHKVNKMSLVKVELIDKYLDYFREQ